MLMDHPTPWYVIDQAEANRKQEQELMFDHDEYKKYSNEYPARKRRFQSLVSQNKEIRALYAKIGYSFDVEREAKELINGLEALVRTEILDFPAFQKALAALQTKIQQPKSEKDPDEEFLLEDKQTASKEPLTPDAARRQIDKILIADAASMMAGNSDFEELIAARDDYEEMLKLLNKNYYCADGLPFYLTRFLRTRPRNPAQFAKLLDELESLFTARWIPQSPEIRQDVLFHLSEVRQVLKREDENIVHSLGWLASKVHSACVTLDYDKTIREKNQQLDGVLWDLWDERRKLNMWGSNFLEGSLQFRKAVQERAKEYVDASWMHTPWLTTYVLT